MSGLITLQVAVSVATLWTSPVSHRAVDEPALRKPADMTGWLKSLTLEDKLELSEANRIQTQALYGTEVIATARSGDWVKVHIPEQTTSRNLLGYPGWVPSVQLTEREGKPVTDTWAEVTSPKALMYIIAPKKAVIELSFLTRLPVIGEAAEQVIVDTPDGTGILYPNDVRIIRSGTVDQLTDTLHAGRRIVEHGSRFIGLPYLWGGLSSFGYDCSGFAYSMYRSQGMTIPRDACDQARQGRDISHDELEPGDLLFFAHDEGYGRIHHVGIYAGGGRMLHSPDSRGCVELIRLDGHKLAREHCKSRRYWT